MLSTSMEEFLSKRQVEIRSELESTRVDIAEHEVRLVGLRAHQQGLEAEMAALELAAGHPRAAGALRRESIKEQILRVLMTQSEPITSQEILDAVHQLNPRLKRTSFSPQLSRLVDEGRVRKMLDGRYSHAPTGV